jgi:hypothetical protein
MRLKIVAAVALFVLPAGWAFAESVVYGYGYSRSDAMYRADRAAADRARARGTCYLPSSTRDGWCVRIEGEWRCKAEVSKYNNRNPGGVCP